MKPVTSVLVFAVVGLIGLAGLSFAFDQNGPATGPQVKVLSIVDVKEKINGEAARASTVEVTFEPGASGAPHRHPGPVFGYVIEGELQFKVEGKPEQTLKTGETFYEPLMVRHEVSRNPSEKTRTRILAVIIHPRDAKQLVIPEASKNE